MSSFDDGNSSQEALYALWRSRMSQNHQNIGAALDRMNNVWVKTARDRVVLEKFDSFLSYVLANQRFGRKGKGNAFFITGASGAGKTDLVEHLLVNHPVMQPFSNGVTTVKPYITTSLQEAATLRVLGHAILRGLNYPVKPTMRQAQVLEILPQQLQASRVFLVHIDETQHLIKHKDDKDAVASAIKGLMNYASWPISFILSGMPKTNELIVHDDQTERREFSLALPSLDPGHRPERAVIEKIIREHAEAAGVGCEALIKTDMPERIAHAAAYQFGRICEVTIHGLTKTVARAAGEVTRDDFAKAYEDHSNTDGDDELNPFLREDWSGLKPGYYVVTKEQR